MNNVFRSRTMRAMCIFIMLVGLFWCGVLASRADTHYVAQGGQTPYTNYTSWATAASNIQDAISVAIAGDTVLVSNGVYQTGGLTNYPDTTILTNRVVIDKAIIVRSANNDPTNTVIKGAWDPTTTNGLAAVRCVYMVNNSSLIGFMLTNGATLTNESALESNLGGGVLCQSTAAVISNCVIAGNSALSQGGGAYGGTLYNCTLTGNSANGAGGGDGWGWGGGAAYSTLFNCTLSGNSAAVGRAGGGAYNCGTLSNCTLIGNSAGSSGGGTQGGTLYNCRLTGNSAGSGGGAAYGSILYNCTLTSNSASIDGGGAFACTLYNCILTGNSAPGDGGGAWGSTMYNCTLTGNSASWRGGGTFNENVNKSYNNSIIYFNTASTGSNWYDTTVGLTSFTNSCTAPAQGGWAPGNITDDPRLVDKGSGSGTNHVAGNYRLAPGSPCRNTGTNFSWMTDPADPRSKDLDGYNRIDKYSGQVDMGCYEYLSPPPGTIFGVR